MPRYTVDLHNHTPAVPTDYRGDPRTTPRDIVERALSLGIDVWGVTDHWCTSYVERIAEAAQEVASETGEILLVVPGAELRIKHRHEETHLVALFPPQHADERFAVLLGSLGVPTDAVSVEQLPFLACEHDPLDVARIVEGVGGVCCIGHADRAFGEYRFIDSDLVHVLAASEHISAIELIDRASRGRLREDLSIARIASSDSHSLDEMGRRTTTLEMPELSFDGLRRSLRAARENGEESYPTM